MQPPPPPSPKYVFCALNSPVWLPHTLPTVARLASDKMMITHTWFVLPEFVLLADWSAVGGDVFAQHGALSISITPHTTNPSICSYCSPSRCIPGQVVHATQCSFSVVQSQSLSGFCRFLLLGRDSRQFCPSNGWSFHPVLFLFL